LGNFLLTSNNVKDYVGRQVFDRRYQNDYGLGVIVSTFSISGETGCRVHYSLDRLVLKHDGPMSGIIVNEPVSGTINAGFHYIRYDQMADRYVAAHPSVREGSIIGMNWNPSIENGGSGTAGSGSTITNLEYRLVRTTYTDLTVDYYPDDPIDYTNGSGGISLLTVL
jgi:hypothetical protein